MLFPFDGPPQAEKLPDVVVLFTLSLCLQIIKTRDRSITQLEKKFIDPQKWIQLTADLVETLTPPLPIITVIIILVFAIRQCVPTNKRQPTLEKVEYSRGSPVRRWCAAYRGEPPYSFRVMSAIPKARPSDFHRLISVYRCTQPYSDHLIGGLLLL